jgi:hypothetical protein
MKSRHEKNNITLFNQNESGKDSISQLTDEVLICIILLLDLKITIRMKTLSNNFYEKINNITSDSFFWRQKAELELEPNYLVGLENHEQLLKDRLFLSNVTNTSTNSFFGRAFSGDEKKINVGDKQYITLKEFAPIVLADNAKGALNKASRFGNMFPYIQD